MELKDFVKLAISEITGAISDLQTQSEDGSVVSPPMPPSSGKLVINHNGKCRLISNIDFDIAVTVGSTDSLDGGAGASFLQVFSAKASAGKETKTENVSRISFSIPVLFPSADLKSDAQIEDERRKERRKASFEAFHNKDRLSMDLDSDMDPTPPTSRR